MNSIKTVVGVVASGVLFAGFIGNTYAATISTDDVVDSLGWTQTEINQQAADRDDNLYQTSANNHSSIINLQQENLLRDDRITTTEKKSAEALLGVAKNGTDIINLQNETNLQGQVLTNHDQRITDLENAPKPTNGKDGINGIDGINGKDGAQGITGANGSDGKDGINGKDGVTTTVTQLDAVTQAKVAKNSQAITTTSGQAASVAQDLKDAKSFFSQQQASNNAQFKSLHDEVDSNKKEARSGAASAVAIASMPQVEAGQTVMFSAGVGSFKDEQAMSVGASFHAGVATVKAGISDSTNNDFAMGAGVGIGF
ncbi:YadA-like protein [Yokenella regensburgei]|uniref:YadA-like protein n=1 Tax=Yokenella regensburgei TaxID=158877 RepID=A0ABX9S0E4_9ENTR|nr:YadA C-terminal domain-containing protein [Yokenella regensburgei]RKR63771.1 YadA-like protein [Yokenella regensburgei]VFS35095.1 YadA-like C-terminal region [Yokenella regensburgei]